ncbi:MAG: hypothetical protein IJ581_01440, partial [Paludibacteraceae bacterium]|nr:hypothetical protein [Paludibacteraceae bacterium]
DMTDGHLTVHRCKRRVTAMAKVPKTQDLLFDKRVIHLDKNKIDVVCIKTLQRYNYFPTPASPLPSFPNPCPYAGENDENNAAPLAYVLFLLYLCARVAQQQDRWKPY